MVSTGRLGAVARLEPMQSALEPGDPVTAHDRRQKPTGSGVDRAEAVAGSREEDGGSGDPGYRPTRGRFLGGPERTFAEFAGGPWMERGSRTAADTGYFLVSSAS